MYIVFEFLSDNQLLFLSFSLKACSRLRLEMQLCSKVENVIGFAFVLRWDL